MVAVALQTGLLTYNGLVMVANRLLSRLSTRHGEAKAYRHKMRNAKNYEVGENVLTECWPTEAMLYTRQCLEEVQQYGTVLSRTRTLRCGTRVKIFKHETQAWFRAFATCDHGTCWKVAFCLFSCREVSIRTLIVLGGVCIR